jgi:hypothetical protein
MRRGPIAKHGHRAAQRTIAVGAPDELRAASKRVTPAVPRVMEHGVTIGSRVARIQRRRVRAPGGRSAVGGRTRAARTATRVAHASARRAAWAPDLVRGTAAHPSRAALATGSGDGAAGAHAPRRAADAATTCRASHTRRSGRPTAARRPGYARRSSASRRPGYARRPSASSRPGAARRPGASRRSGAARRPGASRRSGAARRPGGTRRPSGTTGSSRAPGSARSWARRATGGDRHDGQGKAKPRTVPTKSVQMTSHVRGRSTIQAKRTRPNLLPESRQASLPHRAIHDFPSRASSNS